MYTLGFLEDQNVNKKHVIQGDLLVWFLGNRRQGGCVMPTCTLQSPAAESTSYWHCWGLMPVDDGNSDLVLWKKRACTWTLTSSS